VLVLFKQYLLTDTSCNFVIGSCSSKDKGHNLKPAKHGEQRTVLKVTHACATKMFTLTDERESLYVILLAMLSFWLISASFCEQMQRLNEQ